jgi:uncharacterized membrane protein (UPF0182 family)
MDNRAGTIEYPGTRRRGWGVPVVLAVLALFFGAGTAASYYVDALWFGSVGYATVFWKTLNIQAAVFGIFAAATFAALYGGFLALKPARFGEIGGPDGVIFINGRPVVLPIGPLLRAGGLLLSLVAALIAASVMMADWSTFALWWYGGGTTGAAQAADPILGRPVAFYLFTLPAWELIAGWLSTLAVIACVLALFFWLASTAGRRPGLRAARGGDARGARGVALTWAFVLLAFSAQVYIGRFERLVADHTIFAGVTYTDAHVRLTAAWLLSAALAAGAALAAIAAFVAPRVRWLAAAALPAAIVVIASNLIAAYVDGFIVKPNELVRETPYIAHNIALTRQAFGLDRISAREFPAETTVEAADPAANQDTLQNIRLWDWRALQDTLRQLQEIRTYYDFTDVDIDRYPIGGAMRQVMVATRELNVDKLPSSSRNWINERLIYTHGYGVTMNPVNGFTPEGLPSLILRDMPVQSTVPSLRVTRPEVYFGELTKTDVYVKTRQQEFNYPQGQSNNLTSYEGSGGFPIGGFARRLVIAFDRGDLGKLPFSDDVKPDSRLLMRRTLRDRVTALAPFLVYDEDPYMVLRDDGRLAWIMDAFTVSARYPYARSFRFERERVNYVRNSVKVVVDAYDGTTTFYVFDAADPVLSAYRRLFPALFHESAEMPDDLRRHVRYPEMLLALQAEVLGLYHMTDPEVFYNREDLWTVASEVGSNGQSDREPQPMDPNFVLMKLPGESASEFVEVLPFTPANRNNLIGWIAGRSDGAHYGELVVYDFPKTRLVDGPLQVEARIDQNAQLSGQLSLWNQQGSRVRRGALLVMPLGRALLYAEAIYLQAERSPMPELRLVVLAMQDRLVYAPTYEAALAELFGGRGAPAQPPSPAAAAPTAAPERETSERDATDRDAQIAEAARALADYQRLTAEGKLAEAGEKLAQVKRLLDALAKRR